MTATRRRPFWGHRRGRPKHQALPWLLAAMPPVFLADQLPLVPLSAPVGRMSGFLLLAVLVAALMYRGPRQRLPYGWLPLAFAVFSIPFLFWVSDPLVSLGGRVQWLLMVCAAIAVGRLCYDSEAVQRLVVRPLAVGVALSLLLVATALPFDPAALRNGFGRFMPWGGNPNIVASALLPGVPIYGYLAYRTHAKGWALAGLFTLAVILLTASRGALSAVGLMVVPFVLQRRGRLPSVIAMALVGWASVSLFAGANPGALERLEGPSSSAERLSIAGAYLPVLYERPWWGLAWTHGLPGEAAPEVGTHAHNAYLQYAYWGGLSLLVPLVLLAAVSLWAAVYVWRRRRRAPDPLWAGVLAFSVVAVYVHGLTGIMVFFPTYIWAWFGLLAVLLTFRMRESMIEATSAPSRGITPPLAPTTFAGAER